MLKPDAKGVGKNAEEVKAMFGRPDSSHESNSELGSFTIYGYKNLSVDESGSGKVDAQTIITICTHKMPDSFDRIKFVPQGQRISNC